MSRSESNWTSLARAAAVMLGSAALLRASQAAVLRRWSRKPDLFDPADFRLDGRTHELVGDDGARLFAIEAGPELGSAPTILLGHGIAGDHSHWAPVANELVRSGFRVVVFDQRGHGRSQAGRDGFAVEMLGADLATVVQELGGQGRLVVGGHSMGGIGVQSMLRFRPEVAARIDGFALVATLPEPIDGPVARVVGSGVGLRLYRRILANRSLARLVLRSAFGERFSMAVLDQIRDTWARTPDETLLGLGEGLAGFDFLVDLAGIAVPTVVVCGDRDTVTPLDLSRKIAAVVPGAKLDVVEGAGHMIVWENVDTLVDVLSRMVVEA